MIPKTLPDGTTLAELNAMIDAENAAHKPVVMDESDIVRLPKGVGEFLAERMNRIVIYHAREGHYEAEAMTFSSDVAFASGDTPESALQALENDLTKRKETNAD